jgi:hypothetical protein
VDEENNVPLPWWIIHGKQQKSLGKNKFSIVQL